MDLNKLKTDPAFRKLSYPDQQQVVSVLQQRELMSDPAFMQLGPADRNQVGSVLLRETVGKLKPAFNAWDGAELTDADRLALGTGLLADVPGTQDSYKRGAWLVERMQAGDKDAVREARNWVARNSVGTNSLLVQVAAGVKDAVEVMFGQDDVFGNDLRLQTQDFQKMSDWLHANMPEEQAAASRTVGTVLGTGTALVETVALNMLFVGGPSRPPVVPGMFTQKIWNSYAAKAAAATTAKATNFWTVTAPNLTDALLGGGVVDVMRSLPRLMETGQVQGPKAFTEQLVNTFGQGVAFDLFANVARGFYKYAANPVKMALKKGLSEPADLDQLKNAIKNLDDSAVSNYFTKIFTTTFPKEVYDQLPADLQKEFMEKWQVTSQLLKTKQLDVRTPEGFRLVAKAMGFDAALDPASGKVSLFDQAGAVKLHTFGNMVEAVSYFTAKDFQDVASGTLDETLAGAQKTGRLRWSARVEGSVAGLSDWNLTTMIQGGLHGTTVDEETVSAAVRELAGRGGKGRLGKVQFIPEEDFMKARQFRPTAPREPEGVILLPKTMSPATRVQVMEYLQPILDKLAPNAPKLNSAMPLSVESLNAAARALPGGGSFEQVGSRYLWKQPGQAPVEFQELGTANREVWRALVGTGAVSVDDWARLLRKSTGFEFAIKTDELGVPIYELRGPAGKLMTSARSMDDLMNWAQFGDIYSVKFPDYLVPELFVRKGKLNLTSTTATGPVTSLKKFLEDFKDPRETVEVGTKLKRTLPDGTTADFTTMQGGKKIILEWPSVGLVKTFDGPEAFRDVKSYLGVLGDSFTGIEVAAAKKGLKTEVGPAGSLIFQDGDRVLRATSYEEAQRLLAALPDSGEGPELVKAFGIEFDQSVNESVQRVLSGVQWDEGKWDPFGQSKAASFVEAHIRPAFAYVEDMARRNNMPELSEAMRLAVLGKRAVGMKVHEMNVAMKTLLTDQKTGKFVKRSDAKILGRLMEYAPEQWDEVAKKLNFELTVERRTVLQGFTGMYEQLGKVFGIDFLGFVRQYMPHFRETVTPESLKEILGLKKKQVLEKVFGSPYENLPVMEFLSRNLRLDEVMSVLHEGDIGKMAQFYVAKGYREMYLKEPAERLRKLIASYGADKRLSAKELKSLDSVYGALLGGMEDSNTLAMADASLTVSANISKGFSKLSELFGEEATWLGRAFKAQAEDVVTTDIIGRMNQTMTLATMGFRPFRMVSNSMQYVNAWAFYGRFAAKAPEKLTREKFRELFRRGILNEKIFAASDSEASVLKAKIQDIALGPQQISEYATRAWTAIAAEDAFDEAYAKLGKGMVDFKGFVGLAQIDYMHPDTLKRVLGLMQAGSPEAARDLVAATAVRTFMFDYSKENWPQLFQGVLGRLYGKFGVYPFGQIELYRTIVTNGSLLNRVDRAVRLAAGYFVVRNAFLAAGVDYSGFSMTDPFRFTGGPLWNAAIDVTRLGSQGPEGPLAWRNIQRNFLPFTYTKKTGLEANIPRLTVPYALQARSLLDAAEGAGTDPALTTFYKVIGAPVASEPFSGFTAPW